MRAGGQRCAQPRRSCAITRVGLCLRPMATVSAMHTVACTPRCACVCVSVSVRVRLRLRVPARACVCVCVRVRVCVRFACKGCAGR